MPPWLWIQNVVFPLVGMGISVLFLVGSYRLINRMIDRRHERALAALRGAEPGELKRLHDRVAALENASERLQELEERVDFTERLLARHREARDLGQGR